MTDPRREGGRSPKTTGGRDADDERPVRKAEPMPQGDGDPREREDEAEPGVRKRVE